LLVGVIAVLITAVVLAWQLRPRTGGAGASADHSRLEPTGVLSTGGSPVRDDPALDSLFTELVPDWLVALNRPGRDEELLATRKAVVAAATGRAFAPQLVRVLDAASAATTANEATAEAAADQLATAAEALNDVLAAHGLPYQVEPDVTEAHGTRRVIVFSFAIEHVSVFLSGSHRLRALALRRLDRLNWSFTLLGFTSARRREAVILLTQVEERLIDRLLPMLSDAPPTLYRLGDAATGPWQAEVERAAATAIRRELGTTPELSRLGTLVARRRALFDAWDARLADRGIALATPTALLLPDEVPSELEGYVPGSELNELRSIELELGTEPMTAAFGVARSRLVTSVALHELQHRLDNLRGELRHPPALEEMVGPLLDRDGQERSFAVRGGAELSAYLGALARDLALPQTSLAILLQFILEDTFWDTAEGYAALVVFEGLTAALAPEAAAPLVVDGTIDRAAAAAAYLALAQKSSAALRDAARALWLELFGSELEREGADAGADPGDVDAPGAACAGVAGDPSGGGALHDSLHPRDDPRRRDR
jgi:hypothetical protein